MNATEKLAQGLRCTSVDDARSTLQLMTATPENIKIVKLLHTQLEYQGFQKTKERMCRGWLKRAGHKIKSEKRPPAAACAAP